MMSSPSQAARDCLLIDHKIRLLQDQRGSDDTDINHLQALYDKLTSAWGSAIAAVPSYLPQLKRRLVLVA